MPEFVLDLGDDFERWKSLDSFTQGYIEAMYFTNASSADDGDLEGATFAELAPDSLETIKADCADFQQSFADDLQEAIDQDKAHYDLQRAGNDFWYTRNGHGTGFWDRGLQEIGDRLARMARPYGSVYLYRGDDGLIYLG